MRNIQAGSRLGLTIGYLDSSVKQGATIDVAPPASAPGLEQSNWDIGSNGSRCGCAQPMEVAGYSLVTDTTAVGFAQLHSRVIALENLVITLLADATPQQLDLARAMAQYISPRDGAVPHPLTIQAAELMVQLVDRADHFGTRPLDRP